MTVASSHQLSEAIQQAQDDPNVTSVRITGGGSITRPVILKKYTTFDNSTYSCDVTQENTIFRACPSLTTAAFLFLMACMLAALIARRKPCSTTSNPATVAIQTIGICSQFRH